MKVVVKFNDVDKPHYETEIDSISDMWEDHGELVIVSNQSNEKGEVLNFICDIEEVESIKISNLKERK